MNPEPFIYIAGPCVIESESMTLSTAERPAEITRDLPVRFYFKASYDKANRTSLDSYRGPGLEEGLRILQKVKDEIGVPVISDVHLPQDMAPAGEVLDMIQIPAFLGRQTDLLVAAAQTGKPINIKKGQFIAPEDMRYAVDKLTGSGCKEVLLTERGSTFGYHNLVVDFRSFSVMQHLGCPVIFDTTHAVQIPSQGGTSSGNREYVLPLARAAAAYGIDGLFTEVHPDPDNALCDGPNSLHLNDVESLLHTVLTIRDTVQ
ncbi:MAG: 3-deoxy-8-phosphooctulonate synthase [Candidatus Hydrogenedentota bacterium]|nr:MAG: 3-deoxy-8-phosphooctulonate synthase [Candidatus Hydrogenedentota bacterium]